MTALDQRRLLETDMERIQEAIEEVLAMASTWTNLTEPACEKIRGELWFVKRELAKFSKRWRESA